jgi:hypothetical protein
MLKEFVKNEHENPTHGHQGQKRTLKRILRTYKHPELRRMVNKVIRECQVCIKSKAACYKPYKELQPLPILEKAWDLISMDFITDLPESRDPQTQVRHNSILVIVDRLTKYAYF